MKSKVKPKAPELPYEATVWRYALLAAAHDVERHIKTPPMRQPQEKLLHYAERALGPIQEALKQWHRANDEMHKAIAAGKKTTQ